MALPESTALLLSKLSISEPFSSGVEKIALFLRNTEEQWDPAGIIQPIFTAEVETKLQEYVLLCFFDISKSDSSTLHNAIVYKYIRQLLNRRNNILYPCSEKENRILDELKNEIQIDTQATLQIASRVCSSWAAALLESVDLDKRSRFQFSCLLRNEAAALRERTDYLSDHADTYNMAAIARLLPLVTICDEYAKSIEDLGEIVLKRKNIGTPVLSIQQLMKKDAFDKFLKKISHSSNLSLFANALQLQSHKLIAIQKLLAASTMIRWIYNNMESPLQWIIPALESSTQDEFTIDAGSSLARIRPFLNNSGVEIQGSVLKIDYNKTSLSTLIGTDMLTRPATIEKEISIQDLVSRCMNNDVFLARLLDNPKVYQKPGTIERIATRSRSLSILQKIASNRELYTGQANSGVPLALLKNPTNIPLSSLRMFMNPKYISLTCMKELLKNPYGIRREIYAEVKSFIERKR